MLPLSWYIRSAWNWIASCFSENEFRLISFLRPAQIFSLHGGSLRLRVMKRIGEGGFSFVYLVQPVSKQKKQSANAKNYNLDMGNVKKNDSPVNDELLEAGLLPQMALKKIPVQTAEQLQNFETERRYLQLLRSHPNIIYLIDADFIPDPLHKDKSTSLEQQQNNQRNDGLATFDKAPLLETGYGLLLFPYYQQGTVQNLIDSLQQKRFELSELIKLFKGICEGLLVFHSYQPALAFRDLKPSNILISDTGEAVLMDLGSVSVARIKVETRQQGVALSEYCAQNCTAPYRAPELFDVATHSELDERTDVWSLGCTLYAMAFTGQSPFDGTAMSAVSGRVHFPSNAGVISYPPALQQLIMSMLQVDRTQRPFVKDILLDIQSRNLPQ